MAERFNIEGKLVGIVLAGPREESTGMIVLEDVTLETQAGREFVTGIISGAHPENWVHGLRSAVAWEAIGYYVIFDSKEEYRRRLAIADRPWWRRLFRR